MKQLMRVKKLLTLLMTVVITISMYVTAYADVKSVITSSDTGENTLIAGMPEIAGEGAIVVDLATGYTLYEKDILGKFYPASITKIMTATLAIENLKLEDIVTFSHDAVYSIEPGSSSGYLREGEQITVEQCLYGLMLISGNDIANGLGEAVAGTMEAFAVKMNEKAKELGCKNTNFVNTHGLHDENHYTCPYDMALIAKNAYKNLDFFRTLISETRYVVEPTEKCNETRYWHNTNRLIEVGNQYYDEDCIGGKTGYTDQAGNTLVSFHKIHDREIMIVVMRNFNGAGAFSDTITLCDYINENVSADYFKKLDEKYNILVEQESESNTDAEDVYAGIKNPANADDIKGSAGGEESSFPLPIKILLILVVIFVIYYFYISVQRSKRRKHSRRYYRDRRK